MAKVKAMKYSVMLTLTDELMDDYPQTLAQVKKTIIEALTNMDFKVSKVSVVEAA